MFLKRLLFAAGENRLAFALHSKEQHLAPPLLNCLGDFLLHKCANPACAVSFRDIHVGKLFLVETSAIAAQSKARHRLRTIHQHFWLCDQCSREFTLMFEKERGIIPVPLSTLASSALASTPSAMMTRLNDLSAQKGAMK
ncbi:MAG: hypothetical protein ACRD4I_15705 [Candidatus Angelobacter sp.]